MGLFSKARSPELGVDISSNAVKLLELKRLDNRFRVESYAVEPLPPNAVVEKNINDMGAVARALQAAIKRSGTKARRAAVAVPASASISKTLFMPAGLDDAELEARVELQADQYVPYPLEEVNLHFEVVGPGVRADEIEVLLVASRSENVEARAGVLEAAGLEPRVVDVESYALEGAFPLAAERLGTPPCATVAIVDIGATTTTLTVIHDGAIVYTREQAFGGRQLTEEIMQRYRLTFEAAGRAKRQGGLPADYEQEVLRPFRATMAKQTLRALQFYLSSGRHGAVEHILLAGGCAGIPGAAELIEAQTDVTTSVANPFGRMAVAGRVPPQRLAEDAPALMVACGLAMRAFT